MAMKIRNIGSRGIIVTYDDLLDTEFSCTSNIYIVKGEKEACVIDTFLGPKIMGTTLKEIGLASNDVKYVINTHSDWDHVWGNSHFSGAVVIAHEKLLESKETGEDFEELLKFASGKIKLREPDITFDSKLDLKDIKLELFYTPGHTSDSISIYDPVDRVLIVGDNAENPIPSFIDPLLVEKHLRSLETYLEMDFEILIPGHGEIMTREELMLNITYLQDLLKNDPEELEKYNKGKTKFNHQINLNYLWK